MSSTITRIDYDYGDNGLKKNNNNYGQPEGNQITNAVTEGFSDFVKAGGGVGYSEIYLNYYDYD